jgi:serine protease Do
VLKIDAAGLPSFDLSQAARADAGQTILAFSNIFGVAAGNEPASVQKGTVAVVTRLEARRGVFKTPYRGPVYVLDVTTNNPGAAGGALVTRQGVLIGMLGKELRNAINNTWLNYAIPIDVLRQPVDDIRHGKTADRPATEARQNPEHPLDLASLGIVLIPDLLERTPPYVDYVQPGSPAAKAGIQPDDLILLLGDRLMPSRKALAADLETIDAEDAVKLTLLRGEELVEVTLRAAGTVPTTRKVRP